MELLINSDQSLQEAIKEITDAYQNDRYLKVKVSTGKQRTLTQNGALHLYCRMVSDAMNDAGIEQQVFFKPGFQVQWNERTVKDNIWRPVQLAVTDQESTTKPKREQYSFIYEHINRKLSEHGIHVPWPSKGWE